MGIKYKGVIDSFDKVEVEAPKGAGKYLEIKETPFVFNLIGIVVECVLLLSPELCFLMKNNVFIYQMINPPSMFIAGDVLLSKKDLYL